MEDGAKRQANPEALNAPSSGTGTQGGDLAADDNLVAIERHDKTTRVPGVSGEEVPSAALGPPVTSGGGRGTTDGALDVSSTTGQVFDPISAAPLLAHEAAAVRALTTNRPLELPVRTLNKSRATLTVGDFRILCSDIWLTEELMNSFVALVSHHDAQARDLRRREALHGDPSPTCVAVQAMPRTSMLSTYFFSRLSVRPGFYDYAGVRAWGRKGNLRLDAVDIIIVPILVQNCHWVLAVVNVKDEHFLYYDPYAGADQHGCAELLRRWLQDEINERLGGEVAER